MKNTTATVQAIPLDRIIPTPDNPRRIDPNAPALAELAASIKARGQLQAGIGRPHPSAEGKIDLRAGSRRYHACRMAGLDTMLVSVLDLTDAEAMEITVLENLQRSDLNPMEEAAGVQSLIDTGHPLEVIAADIGKPVSWVARRARLTKLSPAWRKLAIEHSLPAAHLELIARFSPEVQESARKKIGEYRLTIFFFGPQSLQELRQEMSELTRALRLAPWDVKDATLLPKAGACASCQKRSSCSPLLFDPDDFAGKTESPADDTCLDAACWTAKGEALKKRNGAELAVKYPNAIKVGSQDNWSYGYGSNVKDKPKVAEGEYTLVKEGTKGAVPGLMIDGDTAGAIVWVKLKGEKAEKHEKSAKAKESGQPVTSLAERCAQLELRRKALAIDHLRAAVDKAVAPENWRTDTALALLAVFGTDGRRDSRNVGDWTKLELLSKAGEQRRIERAVEALAPVMSRRLVIYQTGQSADAWDEAKKIADLFCIDLAKLKADADADIPEPKSWAKESQGGGAKAVSTPKPGQKPSKAAKARKAAPSASAA